MKPINYIFLLTKPVFTAGLESLEDLIRYIPVIDLSHTKPLDLYSYRSTPVPCKVATVSRDKHRFLSQPSSGLRYTERSSTISGDVFTDDLQGLPLDNIDKCGETTSVEHKKVNQQDYFKYNISRPSKSEMQVLSSMKPEDKPAPISQTPLPKPRGSKLHSKQNINHEVLSRDKTHDRSVSKHSYIHNPEENLTQILIHTKAEELLRTLKYKDTSVLRYNQDELNCPPFRLPSTRAEYKSFFLHFGVPRPFYKSFSFV